MGSSYYDSCHQLAFKFLGFNFKSKNHLIKISTFIKYDRIFNYEAFQILLFFAQIVIFLLKYFKFLEENINDIRETQKEMEGQFGQLVVQERPGSKLENATKNLKAATYGINRSFKQNPIGNDIFEKIEIDRYTTKSIKL